MHEVGYLDVKGEFQSLLVISLGTSSYEKLLKYYATAVLCEACLIQLRAP
jgi:hypothetical protein